MSSFGANRKPTFCFLLHLICIRKKIREVALKMSKLLAKFYVSLSSFSRNRDFIPARRFFVGALTSLRQPNAPTCPSTACLSVLPFETLLLGADSLSSLRRNPGFFVGWSSSSLAKLAVLLTSDHFLGPIVCLADRDTRFARTHSLISHVIRSRQHFFNNFINFVFHVNINVQLRVLILFKQNVGAQFCIKRVILCFL